MSSAPHQDSIDFRLERTIYVARGGNPSTGQLSIGPIRWLPDRSKWACHCSIHIILSEGTRIYGDDPLEALDRTMQFVAHLIRGSIQDGFQMWWRYEGDACGFGPKL